MTPPAHRARRAFAAALAIVALSLSPAAHAQAGSPPAARPAAKAAPPAFAVKPGGYVGESVCLQCHAEQEAHFAYTSHSRAFARNPRTDLEKHGCESCHGPGVEHVKKTNVKGLIVGFTREWGTPVEAMNGACLACHQGGQRLHWPGSVHARGELACVDCHNPMARLSPAGALRKAGLSAVCEGCHAQQKAEFRRRSHMPLPEGKMSCVDCHNPHGSTRAPLLKADSVNELCYGCHAEKRGPFLWEHAPVRENCAHCHAPHGSNHDKLLVAARPFLCQQCHDAAGHSGQLQRADQLASALPLGGTPNPRTLGRACQNCHAQIHGSNHPAGARFQR